MTSFPIAATAIRRLAAHDGSARSRVLRDTVWFSVIGGLFLGIALSAMGLKIAGGAFAVLGLAPLFVSLDRETVPGLLPGPCMFAYLHHALGFAIGPLGYLLTEGQVPGVMEQGFVSAQWGAVLGLLTFAVCYLGAFRFVSRQFAPASRLAGPTQPGSEWNNFGLLLVPPSIFIVVYGFASGINNRLSHAVAPSAAQATIFTAFAATPLIMFFFLGYAAAQHRPARIVWWCVVCVYSGLNFLDGSRGPSAWALLFSLTGMHMAGLRLRKVVVPLIVFTVVFVPLASVLATFRTTFVGAESLSERWAGLGQSIANFQQSRSRGDERGVEAFLYSVTAQSADVVFELTPKSRPFVGFSGMENIRYVLLPRILDPNRPDADDPNALAIDYGGLDARSTGAYFTTVGDGYRRFGWPGIVLLYAWLAIMWAFVGAWAWTRRHRSQWIATFILVTVLAPGVWSTTLPYSFYVLLWVFPKYFVLFLVLGWIRGLFQRHKLYTSFERACDLSPTGRLVSRNPAALHR
jgi:hypothetical protein